MVKIPTKWQKLLSQIEIFGNGGYYSTKEEIQVFEIETGIILPADYKIFCQVFESGKFNRFVTIDNIIGLQQYIKSPWYQHDSSILKFADVSEFDIY